MTAKDMTDRFADIKKIVDGHVTNAVGGMQPHEAKLYTTVATVHVHALERALNAALYQINQILNAGKKSP